MSKRLPSAYAAFKETYPEIWQAYDALGAVIHGSGPLDPKTRELIKLAMAIGIGSEGAVHSHTRKLIEAGASAEEIRQVVLLSVTTVGFPSMMAALTWVEDILGGE